jgi:hypothetical protein
MRTVKIKNMRSLKLTMLMFLALLMSCGDDEVVVGSLEDIAGEYRYTQEFFFENGGFDTDQGILFVTVQDDQINLSLDNDGIVMRSSMYVIEGDRIGFDLENESVTIDDISIFLGGLNTFEVNGVEYHGGYDKSSDRVEFAFRAVTGSTVLFYSDLVGERR